MTEQQREQIVTAMLRNSLAIGGVVGVVNLAHCHIAAGLKLLVDAEGPEAAWLQLRDALQGASETARQMAHLRPRSIGRGPDER
jgi:hypothetical protein